MAGTRMGRVASSRRVACLVLCALLLPAAPSAAEWKRASSEHFEIYTTAGDRRARETLAQFERIRSFFAEHLALTPPRGRLVSLILFSNEREFRPYRINDAVVAYYRPGPDRDYVVMQQLGRATHSVVVHEYVHLILNRSGGRYPVWLNEGLAEYFSTLPSSGETVPVGRASRIRARGLQMTRLLDLDQLFAVTAQSPEYQNADVGGRFYAQSWALTHMLLSDDRYKDGAERFLALVRRGTPSADALVQTYHRSLGEVETDLEAYVREAYYRIQPVRFQEPEESSPMPVQEVSAFDAGLVMANLFAAAREDADKARSAFEELAKENADSLALLESRALLEIRTGRAREAVPFLRRAVDVGSRDAGLHQTLAALIADEDNAGAVDLLQRAILLDPSNVRARIQLAALIGARSPADALAVLDGVTGVNALEAFDVIRVRANAYLAMGDLDQAHASARDLVDVAQSSRRRRSAASDLLSRVEAQLAVRDGRAIEP